MPPSPPYSYVTTTVHSSVPLLPLDSNFPSETQQPQPQQQHTQTQYRHQDRIHSHRTPSPSPSASGGSSRPPQPPNHHHHHHHQLLPNSSSENRIPPSSSSTQPPGGQPGGDKDSSSSKQHKTITAATSRFRLSRVVSRSGRGPHFSSKSRSPAARDREPTAAAAQQYKGRDAEGVSGGSSSSGGEGLKLNLGIYSQAANRDANASAAGPGTGTTTGTAAEFGSARSGSSSTGNHVGTNFGIGVGIGIGDDHRESGAGSYNDSQEHHHQKFNNNRDRERERERERQARPQQQKREGSRSRNRSEIQTGSDYLDPHPSHHRGQNTLAGGGDPTIDRGTELLTQAASSGNSSSSTRTCTNPSKKSISTSAAGATTGGGGGGGGGTSLTSTSTSTSPSSPAFVSTATTAASTAASTTAPTAPATGIGTGTGVTFTASASASSASASSYSTSSKFSSTPKPTPIPPQATPPFSTNNNNTTNTTATTADFNSNSNFNSNPNSPSPTTITFTTPNYSINRGAPPRIGPRSSSLLPPPQRDYIRSNNNKNNNKNPATSSPSPPSAPSPHTTSTFASTSAFASAFASASSSRVNANAGSAITESTTSTTTDKVTTTDKTDKVDKVDKVDKGPGSTSNPPKPDLAINVPLERLNRLNRLDRLDHLGHLDHDPISSVVPVPVPDPLTESSSNNNNNTTTATTAATTQPEDHDNFADLTPVSEGFRNLNRWSASTTSTINRSPTTALEQTGFHQYRSPYQQSYQQPYQQPYQHHHTTSSASSRRLSIDSIAYLAQQHHQHQLQHLAKHSPGADSPSSSSIAQSFRNNSSPRKLAKRRVSSTSSLGGLSPSQLSRAKGQPPPRPSPPPASARPPPRVPAPNLPPIVSLPPLDADPTSLPLRSDSALSALRQPSSALGSASGSAISSRNSADSNTNPNNNIADALADRTDRTDTSSHTDTRGNTPALLPAAPLVPGTMRGHVRNKSSTVLGGGGAPAESPKAEKRSKPSQKAMLSKALAKANTAVQLDNAQNYEGARKSYMEACELLHQVLARTTGDEDRKKLEAIRGTYTARIDELDSMIPEQDPSDKELPARPESLDYAATAAYESSDGELEEPAEIHAASATRFNGNDSPIATGATSSPASPRRLPTLDASRLGTPPGPAAQRSPLQSSFSPMRRNFEGSNLSVSRADDPSYMPAPLSPRRPISPTRASSPDAVVRRDFSLPSDRLSADSRSRGHTRNPSHESVSWLDPIDESGGSVTSSVHSRTSSLGVRRKHIRGASANTEAEFDAALDAAVEAAYDDGYEPMEPSDMNYDHDDQVANAMRKVELAKERVRQTEREAAIEFAREKERQRRVTASGDSQTFGVVYDGNDSDEEEERILDEITSDFVMGDYSFSQQSKQTSSSTARESSSSSHTSRTWHSSMGSNPPTATTTLSTVTELPSPAPGPKGTPPSLLPSQGLPKIPPTQTTPGVRTRRLSGRNAGQLKIETQPGTPEQATAPATAQPKTGNYIVQQRQQAQAQSATSTRPGIFSARSSSPRARGHSDADEATSPTSRPTGAAIPEEDEDRTDSPSMFRPNLHTNFSSSSLKNLKQRQLSVTNMEDSNELSPLTPLSQQPTNSSLMRQGSMPAIPQTPLITSFRDKSAVGVGGLYLFDADFHVATPQSPTSTNQRSSDVPLPLEPCPADVMLRPFWLMRALYQTLANPKGGYLTNKLFIPREAWKVRGVKLRNLEDKMAQCDLLTAALLKLGRVDSTDADAMLEEMQGLENILEIVQSTLTRKLGNEVGPSFSDKDGEQAVPSVPRSASVSSKGAFSWRRLRSKGSAVNLTSAYGPKSNSGNGGGTINEKEVLGGAPTTGSGSIPSLPMVPHPSSRPAKRDVASVRFDGPYGGYMASLARLFDAAQTVDQIARQVDDPGLRHADKTQVGLELCTRHAAEFFGFYICRFVLLDLSMLMDKYVKRGTEWVLN